MSTKVRYFGIGEEATPGTAVAATKYLPLDEGAERIVPSQGFVFPRNVSGRTAQRAIPGLFGSNGDVSMDVIPVLTHLLKWGLGGVTTTSLGGTPAAYKHEFKLADVLKTFTARIGAEEAERVIAGCMINRLHFASVVRDVVLKSVFGIDGGEEVKASIGTPTFPSGDDAKEFSVLGAAISLAGSDKKAIIEALRLTITNAVPERWTHEGRYKKRSKVAETEITGDMALLFPDTTEYDRFLAGTPFALQQKAEGATISGANKYTFQIDLAECYYLEDVAPHIERREELKLVAPWKATYAASYPTLITVINKESTI